MQHKHSDNRMKLRDAALQPQAQWNLFKHPSLVHPVCHYLHEDQGHGDRGSLEVLGFARRVFGQHGDCDVEAREAGEAAEDEEGEEEVVERRAETEAEGGGSGGYAE